MGFAQDKTIQQQPLNEQEKLKVLIADDDIPTRILLRAAISKWGYDVTEARDGEEAWEALQNPDAPRLIILDWLMPKLDGIALCSRIKRELSSAPYFYVILLTQLSETSNIVKGVEAGADEFLPKPFNMAELRTRLAVGTRLVRDENKLAEQNKQLQSYVSYVDALSDISANLAKEIDSIASLSSSLEKNAQNELFLQKIDLLKESTKNIKEAISSFQATQKK